MAKKCKVCDWEAETGRKVDAGMSSEAWGTEVGVHRTSITRHLGHAPHVPEVSERQTTGIDKDGTRYVEAVRDRPITLDDWRKWIEVSGDDPDDFIPSIRSIAYGQGLFSNRLAATPKKGVQKKVDHNLDPVGILAQLRAERPIVSGNYSAEWSGDESAFGLSINDIQLGQSYNGGSAATIKQFYEFVEMARLRIIELRKIGRALDTLIVVGGGDLGEGCTIYPNQSFNLDLNRKQQSEGVIALILHALDTLAPMFKRVIVLAARGNHGENRINGNYTTLDDNDDTHAFEMAKLALSRDQSMQHIEWTIAESEAGVAVKVYDWVLATTHGDIYAKGVTGATIDKKAQNWFKNMAMGRERFGLLGQASVIIGHHFHHDKMSDWGSCLWRQTPSQDRGSPYFEQATGEYSDPGMLTWVMTPRSRWQDEAVLR